MCNIFQIQLRLGLLIATFGLVVACLITNCPRGGKRSEIADDVLADTYSEDNPVYCTPCGADNTGVCIGRGICCWREIGCRTSPECRDISAFRSSCLTGLTVPAPACGEKGRCKSRYLCCSEDSCVLDISCKSMPSVKFKDAAEPAFTTLLFPSLLRKNVENPIGADEDDNWKPRDDWSMMDYES